MREHTVRLQGEGLEKHSKTRLVQMQHTMGPPNAAMKGDSWNSVVVSATGTSPYAATTGFCLIIPRHRCSSLAPVASMPAVPASAGKSMARRTGMVRSSASLSCGSSGSGSRSCTKGHAADEWGTH